MERPSEAEIRRRMVAFAAQREDMIAEYGHSVQAVFCTEDDPGPSFSYSIGLQDCGWPELIVMGLSPQTGHIIINAAVEHYRKREKAPAVGDVLTELGNWPMAVGPVTEHNVHEYLCQAVGRAESMSRPAPEALQLVYPDKAGRWPPDPEFDHEFMDARQPKLGAEWVVPKERAKEALPSD